MKSNPIPCGAGFHHESDFIHASGFNPSRTDLIMQATACIIRPMHLDNFQKGASRPRMHFGTVYCIKSTFFCQYIFSFLLIFSENVMTVIHKIQQFFTKKQAVFDIFLRFCSIQCLCRILGFDCIFMRYSSLSCSFPPRICTSIQARVCSHICV